MNRIDTIDRRSNAVLWPSTLLRLLGVLGGGLVATGVLWAVHLQTSGLVWMFATVGSLAAGALTVAVAISLIVNEWGDARTRTHVLGEFQSSGVAAHEITERCRQCRRPLVVVNDLTLCLICDQRPPP